jgi:OmpA-OmpF porin, OOP family
MRQLVVLGSVLSLVLTGGCTTWSLEELRQATPTGDAFQTALSQKYRDFAEAEVENYDWWSQMYFADKGLSMAYGKDIGPEDLDQWDLPAHALPALSKAREALMMVLESKARETSPELLADAQFNFDCWVEEQEENWQDDDIARCRDGFAVAMQKLAGNYKEEAPPPATGEAEQSVAPMVPPLLEIPKPGIGRHQDVVAYVVFFEWNTSSLSAQGVKVTDQVVDLLKGEDRYEVILNGHSDTAESKEGDFALSQRRADAVKQRLVSGGVKEEAIQTFAFGSSDPHVKNGPNTKEPANRRVEIFLND